MFKLSEPYFEICEGTVDRIGFSGQVRRDSTVLIRVGRRGLSKRAILLGKLLVLCHIFDGLFTFFGMELFGIGAEGNVLLREAMFSVGAASALFLAKTFAIALTLTLTFLAHRRLWLRPIIAGLVVVYLFMAIFPWAYILSEYLAKSW